MKNHVKLIGVVVLFGFLFVVGCTTPQTTVPTTIQTTVPATIAYSNTPTQIPPNESSTMLIPTSYTPSSTQISDENYPQTILDKTYSVHLEDFTIVDLTDALKDNPLETGIPYEFNIAFPENINPVINTDGKEIWPNINVVFLSSTNDKIKMDVISPTFNPGFQTWDYSGINPVLHWDDVIYGKKIITFNKDIPKFLILDARKGFFLKAATSRVFPVSVKIIKNPIEKLDYNNEKILFEDSVGVHHDGYYFVDLGDKIGPLNPGEKYKLYVESPWAGQTVVLLNCNALVLDSNDKGRFANKPVYDTINRKWVYGFTPVVQLDDVYKNEKEFGVERKGNYYIAIDNRVYPGPSYYPQAANVFPVEIRLTQIT
jgi:hypothetical protein